MRAEEERGRQVLAHFLPVKAVVFKRKLVSYFEITQYIEKPTFFFLPQETHFPQRKSVLTVSDKVFPPNAAPFLILPGLLVLFQIP